MFRYSLNSSIGEIKTFENIPNEGPPMIFPPSNGILPLATVPILIDGTIQIFQWGFQEETIITTIEFTEYLKQFSNFHKCLIPMNGYFVMRDQNFGRCIFRHKNNERFYQSASF